MKYFLAFYILLAFALSATKCKNNPQDPNQFLLQSWMHSHEEDNEQGEVYRLSSYDFPPSRGRDGYEFKADGLLISMGPGATDRPESQKGKWEILSDGSLKLNSGGSESNIFKLVSLEKNKLVLSSIKQ